MSAQSPYRTLPAERRLALVTHEITVRKESREGYVQRILARGGGFRRETLRKWPAAQLAREVVRAGLETPHDELGLLLALYVELEPAIQIAFLEAAGVPHDGANIPEELPTPYADAETVAAAAKSLLETYGEDGRRYLVTIAHYNGEAWPGLDRFLAGPA